jgi:hypothetical protein
MEINMFPARTKKAAPSLKHDPAYLTQLKLEALSLIRTRDAQKAVLDRTLARLEAIEGVFGESADRLKAQWGYSE